MSSCLQVHGDSLPWRGGAGIDCYYYVCYLFSDCVFGKFYTCINLCAQKLFVLMSERLRMASSSVLQFIAASLAHTARRPRAAVRTSRRRRAVPRRPDQATSQPRRPAHRSPLSQEPPFPDDSRSLLLHFLAASPLESGEATRLSFSAPPVGDSPRTLLALMAPCKDFFHKTFSWGVRM
jgi:hypothetical protein